MPRNHFRSIQNLTQVGSAYILRSDGYGRRADTYEDDICAFESDLVVRTEKEISSACHEPRCALSSW